MNVTWATPQKFFDKIHAEFRFTLDVCALPETAKCDRYFTPEQDGLAQSWSGQCCWMNPPYGKEIGAWMQRASEFSRSHGLVIDGIEWSAKVTNQGVVVALVPTRTNAPWWHDYVLKAHEIRFVVHKLSFDGAKRGTPFTGHALVVFRPGVLPPNGPKCSSWYQRDEEGVRG